MAGNVPMVQILLDGGADVHCPDVFGVRPLHHAACLSSVRPSCVPKYAPKGGTTGSAHGSAFQAMPKKRCWFFPKAEAARELLRRGAEMHGTDSGERTPLVSAYPGLLGRIWVIGK
jgi:hypothetical protein